MKIVTILKGLPASGKSTWAKQMVKDNKGSIKRINKDDLRNMLDVSVWSRDNEKFILNVRDDLILKSLEAGKHVIVDDTNLHPKHEERIRKLVKGKAKVVVHNFDVDVEECIARDLKRTASVGEKVIRDMYSKFLKPEDTTEKYVGNPENPPAYIFDIDGTLALMKDRSPYDWHRVGEDDLNIPVAGILSDVRYADVKIIIFTGRDGVCKKDTLDWLRAYNIAFDYFDIRPEGNTEKDSIVKKRMFDKIKDKYNVIGVFDDRKQVKQMWVDMGLFVFDVNQYDEVF